MKFESVENLIVRQKARTLAIETMSRIKSDVNFAPVFRRTTDLVMEIMNTIAEAYEMPNRKELVDKLYITKQKTGALRSMLHLLVELGSIDNATHAKLYNCLMDVTKLLSGFIKKLKDTKPYPG